MKEEHDRLNVPQGTGIVDWKAVKAAADAQCDDVIYVVEREASYNDPQDRVACLAGGRRGVRLFFCRKEPRRKISPGALRLFSIYFI